LPTPKGADPQEVGVLRRILLAGIVCLLLITSVVSADQPDIEPSKLRILSIQYIDFTPVTIAEQIEGLVNTVKEQIKLGIKPVEEKLKEAPTEIDPVEVPQKIVMQDGEMIAIVPADSAIVDIRPHAFCKPYQYGTDGWFDCEARLTAEGL